MCRYHAWEDDSLPSEDFTRSTTDGAEVTQIMLAAERLAILEMRMTRVEARVKRIEERMLYLEKVLSFVCVWFLVTFVYTLTKEMVSK